VAVARAEPAGVVAGVVSSLLSHDHEDIRMPFVAIENSALVSTDPGYVYATSPALVAGLLNCHVPLLVGTDEPTGKVLRYAGPAPWMTGVIVPATI
jgi:hypothetical protein